MQDRPSDPTAKDEVFTVPAPMSGSLPKKRLVFFSLVVISLIVFLIGGISSVFIYQNNVNQTNTHNAYLSALSGNGTLVFSDSLSQESQWWRAATDGETTCQFEGNAYHIKPQGRNFMGCYAQGTYSDFAFEVQLTITQGDCGGVVFRDSHNGDGLFYYFSIYQDGTYDIARYANYGIFEHLLPYGNSSAIHTGLGQQNKIAVKASGSTLTFYVNEQQIQQLQDHNGYTSGSIGLAAYPNIGNSANLAFTNARLWTL